MINEKEYAKVIARNLRNIMYERHLTQADLARALNINKATISSWMNATRTPKMSNIDILCDYFDVNRSALMEPHGYRIVSDSPTTEREELIKMIAESDDATVHFMLELMRRIKP